MRGKYSVEQAKCSVSQGLLSSPKETPSVAQQGHFDAVLTDLSLSDFTLSNPELPVNPSRFLKDSCVLLRITFEEMESENQANRLPSNDGSVFSVGSAAASAAPVGAPPTGPCVFGEGAEHCTRGARSPPTLNTYNDGL